MKNQQSDYNSGECTQSYMAVRDTMDLLSGKWKIPIISTLIINRKLRFMELVRVINGIAPKMLSKELQELELNQLITRKVCSTKPITVEYEITEYGMTLTNLMTEMINWGKEHRNRLFKKSE